MWILRYVLAILALSGAGQSAPGPLAPGNPALYPETHRELLTREDTTATADANSSQTAQNFWQLSKKAQDIDEFQKLHNLILVESTPQDAAFMPSWPQALVQYILINPPINCFSSSTHEINGQVVSSFTITPFNILQLLLSPFLFVAWVVAFGMTQASFKSGGWMSVLGWAMWFDLSQFYTVFAAVPLIFQYPASLALVIQRWHSDLGRVAYEVTNLNGCTPYQGLDYLQQGARSGQFRILQTVTFSIATLFGIMSLGNPSQMAPAMALPALAELIMTAIVATKGTPMVVSGNCLLVELGPNKGFLDSPVSTRWKVFASFMGF